jgi:hypothetical protein
MEMDMSETDTLRVNFYSWTAKTLGAAGKEEAVMRGSDISLDLPLPTQRTLQGLLESIAERYPLFGRDVYNADTGRINTRVTLFLNGRSIAAGQALQTQIKSGDLVAIVPLTEGG